MTVGERLAKLRNEVGLKQKEVSGMLGVATSTLGSWETNANMPTTEKLIELSEIYNVNIDYILGCTYESISWKDLLSSYKIGSSEIKIKIIVETFLSFGENERRDLLDYAQYLKYRQEKRSEKNK